MNQTKWLVNIIVIFSLSIIALVTSLFLYIYWYIEVSAGLQSLVKKFNIDPKQVLAAQTWVVILVLSVLVVIILLGIFLIFVYHQKTFQLYKLQNNFINSFTHELKTPVTSLKLFLETFLKYEISRTDQIKYVEYMLADVSRLSDNINRILNLARIETKSYKGEFIILDIKEAIQKFYNSNHYIFDKCVINICNTSQKPLFYPINLPLFEMLLMNITTNAIKYNESEKPQLDINFKIHNKELHISFKDNGIGLDKKETKKIFKKFYQVGKSDNMSAKGNGLGLYMVQHIARLHKGKAKADSKGIGNGSEIKIILPYYEGNAHGNY
ncbi:MAG: HAMP domain-containing histidine kinase [Desulfobacterales bacterium]|nr:HAMP domain-containing histidine kinase [Desulfobacterales bacterium]